MLCSEIVINRYEPFDFHKECRKMQWHKLSILINRLSAEQGEFKYAVSICVLVMVSVWCVSVVWCYTTVCYAVIVSLCCTLFILMLFCRYYFHSDDNSSLNTKQTGVFRTNCIDCLDRYCDIVIVEGWISMNYSLRIIVTVSLDKHLYYSCGHVHAVYCFM